MYHFKIIVRIITYPVCNCPVLYCILEIFLQERYLEVREHGEIGIQLKCLFFNEKGHLLAWKNRRGHEHLKFIITLLILKLYNGLLNVNRELLQINRR